MTWTRTKTAMVVGAVLIVAAGTALTLVKEGQSSRSQKPPWRKPIPTDAQLGEANAGRPDLQIQAKTLIFCAMAQKKIPDAANWCEILNAGGRLWPVTPTNTVFALNSQMAGRTFSRTMHGDTVVFFETSSPGWNRTGGAELLAEKNGGVIVALLDGRSLIVPPSELSQLRWVP